MDVKMDHHKKIASVKLSEKSMSENSKESVTSTIICTAEKKKDEEKSQPKDPD